MPKDEDDSRDLNPLLEPFYRAVDRYENPQAAAVKITAIPHASYSPGDLRIDHHCWPAEPYRFTPAPPETIPARTGGMRAACILMLGSAVVVIAALAIAVAWLTGGL